MSRRPPRLALSIVLLASWPVVGAQEASVDALVGAAVAQSGVTTGYDPAYRRLDYPNGDVPRETGVCADVVVRALRGIGVDLQKDMHEDMRANFAAYPANWGLKRPDPNIDHRRVANQMTFFARRGKSRAISARAADYEAGDIVAWRLDNGLLHIGVVAGGDGIRPGVVHNIGAGTQIEDVLFAWEIIGHYRWITE